MENKLVGQVDQEQINKWKALHKDVYAVTVDGSICYLKKPNRATMSHMATLSTNPIRANEVLLNDTWLAGDESIKTDDDKFFGVTSQLAQIIEIKEAELKKL